MLVRNLLKRGFINTFSTAKATVSLKKGQISQVIRSKFRSLAQLSTCNSKETFLPSSMHLKSKELKID